MLKFYKTVNKKDSMQSSPLLADAFIKINYAEIIEQFIKKGMN